MVRINLLPPEITEKRKYERLFGIVLFVGAILIAVVAVAYVVLSMQVGGRQSELQDVQTRAAQTRSAAQAFAVFEQRESVLDQRLAMAQLAMADRVDWGRLTEELSLVLPEDTWVTAFACDQASGLQMACVALDDDLEASDHKAVAKTLVRLAQLEQLNNVWLTSSAKAELTEGEWEQPIINFAITAGLE